MVENILDGRPMEGITCPELLEHSLRLLEATLDGELIKKISDWEPEASSVPDATLDGRLREGNTYLEHSAPGVPWTVDSWRGCRVWNHWSGRFLIQFWSHDLVKQARRGYQIGSR